MLTYAQDGKCHNAEPGTFGHECGAPATWIGTKANGFQSGFCDECKAHGTEARRFAQWQRTSNNRPGDQAAIVAEETGMSYSDALVFCNMD